MKIATVQTNREKESHTHTQSHSAQRKTRAFSERRRDETKRSETNYEFAKDEQFSL